MSTVIEIEDKVLECVVKAEAHYRRKISIPVIEFSGLDSNVSGKYRYSKGRNTLWFNARFFENEKNGDYVLQTVPHEVAHYIVHVMYYYLRPRPHGNEWKFVMESIFGRPALRCHDYDTGFLKAKKSRNIKRFAYGCGCNGEEHIISSILHNRILRGSNRRCRICKERIHFIEEVV